MLWSFNVSNILTRNICTNIGRIAIMERSRLLPLPPNICKDLRKLHNLDEPGRLEEAINILEEWLKKQDHLLKKDFSKRYLENTLYLSKGSVEKAKKRIDGLATMKTLLPKFFPMKNIKAELEIEAASALIVPLPVLTEDLYRVLLVKYTKKPIDTDWFMKVYRFFMIMAEYLKRYDCVNGFIIIEDMRDASIMDIVTKINWPEFQQCMNILIEGFGARMKGIYIITESKTIEVLVKALKQVLSDKIGKRLHAFNTLDDMYQKVPKEVFPAEYGGNEKSIYEMWSDWLHELSSPKHIEYMEMMSKAGTDESLRISCQFNEEYTGMPGSFRHLSVD